MADKAKIKIDGKEYSLDELSNEAKVLLQNIMYVNNKIADLQSQIAVMNAAKSFYTNNLKAVLESETSEKKEEDEKIKFS